MKPLLNNLWAGAQRVSLQRWPDLASAKKALGAGLGKIEWQELEEPLPAA